LIILEANFEENKLKKYIKVTKIIILKLSYNPTQLHTKSTV